MHDIGKGCLYDVEPDAYRASWTGSDMRPTHILEQARFGTHHAGIGAELFPADHPSLAELGAGLSLVQTMADAVEKELASYDGVLA